jgi:hypothetical protein
MKNTILAKGFALAIATMITSTSVFATTTSGGANGSATPVSTQPVVVTNATNQPVPIIGVVRDSDLAARKPFQWSGSVSYYGGGNSGGSNLAKKVLTVPLTQRLVIEDVSGFCNAYTTMLTLHAYNAQLPSSFFHYLPAAFWNGSGPASTMMKFYVDPGYDLNFGINYSQGPATCYVTITGHFVDLQ